MRRDQDMSVCNEKMWVHLLDSREGRWEGEDCGQGHSHGAPPLGSDRVIEHKARQRCSSDSHPFFLDLRVDGESIEWFEIITPLILLYRKYTNIVMYLHDEIDMWPLMCLIYLLLTNHANSMLHVCAYPMITIVICFLTCTSLSILK